MAKSSNVVLLLGKPKTCMGRGGGEGLVVWESSGTPGTTTHPGGRRMRVTKGGGRKEPEVWRGETHLVAPRSRWALPRSHFAGGCWLLLAGPCWATLIALVLITKRKQRFSPPSPWVCATLECQRAPGGASSCCSLQPSDHSAPQKRPHLAPKDRTTKQQQEVHGGDGLIQLSPAWCCCLLVTRLMSRAPHRAEGTTPC